MSTTKKKETGRPAEHHHEPNAPKATAASDPILPTICLALRATPPDIPPGAVVEIDLFGEGVEADYASLLVSGFTDAEYTIDAAGHMISVLRDLKQARAKGHDRPHVDFWAALISRLYRAEHHLSRSGVDGADSLAVLAGQANRRMITALRDGVELGASDWDTAESLLTSAGTECLGLADKVEGSLRDGPESSLSFRPLSEGSDYANSDILNAGLMSAARLGPDLNDLEVGYSCGRIARIIRGNSRP